MKIGIDASSIEEKIRTGLHSYLLSIIYNLSKVAPENEYNLYFKKSIPHYVSVNLKSLNSKVLRKPLFFSWIQKPLWNTYCIPKELFVDKIDIFFSPNYTLPPFFWSPTKSVVAIHDISYEVHPEWFPSEFVSKIRQWSKISAKKANVIITNSRFCKSEIAKHYKIKKEKIFVVNPGISRHFDYAKKVKLKTPIEKPFILSVGNFYPRRNVPGLIKAFRNIANKIKYHKLVLVGSDFNCTSKNIKKLISETNKELGSERIMHKENISDLELKYLFENADFLISLSNYEGFGCYSMLEAMAYGCPVVAVRASSMPELLGETGVYTSHDNVEMIGNTMCNIIKDVNLRKRLSKTARERIKKFSTKNMTRQFIEACNYAYNN